MKPHTTDGKATRLTVKSWDAQKAKLKARFPKLTDEDLYFDLGQKAEMFRKLEFKLALTAAEIQDIVE